MTTPTPQPACSPGPWSASYVLTHPSGKELWAVYDANGEHVLFVEGKANAQLIARAPETARLLRELVEAVEKMRGCLVAGAVHETEMAAVVALEEAITIHDANFTPLLTQIQKLEGGGE